MAGVISHTVGTIAAAGSQQGSLEDLESATAIGVTTVGNPITVTGGIRFNTDGTIDNLEPPVHNVYEEVGNWFNGVPSPGYTIRAHVDSGDALDAGSVDTDLALTSNRTFEQSVTGENDSDSSTVTFTLKRSGVTIDTKQVIISAAVSTV